VLAIGLDQAPGDALRLAVGVGVRGVDRVDAGSRADATMRAASCSSVWSPNIIVPSQSGETFRPLAPNGR
jgi:hypothetical protein